MAQPEFVQGDYDADLEWEIVADVMFDPALLPRVLRHIEPDDLYDPGARRVLEAISELNERRLSPDAFSVRARLRESGEDEALVLKAFGADRFRTLGENAETHAKTVRNLALRRKLRAFGSDLVHREMSSFAGPDSWYATAAEELRRLGGTVRSGSTTATEVMDRILVQIDEEASRPPLVETGFPRLDRTLDGGLWPGRVYVVGARPKVGKTTILGNVARAALSAGRSVLFASLEMSPEEIMLRMLAESERKPIGQIRRPDNAVRLASAMNWRVEFLSAPLSPIDVENRAREMGSSLDLVVIDYIQLFRPKVRLNSRVAEVDEISRSIKVMAQELHVPVLAAAQLNRGVEERKEREPRLNDFREAGGIENDLDAAFLLHRLEDVRPLEATLMLRGNRHGPAASFPLLFEPHFSRFHEDQTREVS